MAHIKKKKSLKKFKKKRKKEITFLWTPKHTRALDFLSVMYQLALEKVAFS